MDAKAAAAAEAQHPVPVGVEVRQDCRLECGMHGMEQGVVT